MTRRPPKTKPLVLRALALLGLSDSDVARLLELTPQTVSHWTHARRPIPAVTHAALWYLVARLSGALGPGDVPRGVLQLDPNDEAAKVLAAAAKAAIADAPDEATVAAGADLGERLLERLADQARAEVDQVRADAIRLVGRARE